MYLIQNPLEKEVAVHFTVADVWKKKRPDLFENGFSAWELSSGKAMEVSDEAVTVTLAPGECKIAAILRQAPVTVGNFFCGADGEELLYIQTRERR